MGDANSIRYMECAVDELLDVMEKLVGAADDFWSSLNWTELRPTIDLALLRGRPALAASIAVEWALHDEDNFLDGGSEPVADVIADAVLLAAQRGLALAWDDYPLREYPGLCVKLLY